MKIINLEKYLLLLFLCCSLKISTAQSLSPEIISPSGASFSSTSSQLDWTLGEPVTSLLTISNAILTQGFHQPNLLVTAISSVSANYSVAIFPNPTVDFIQLQIQNLLNEVIFIELYTVEGKLLQTQQLNSSADLQIDMTKYNSGTYQLSIKNNFSKNNTYQIIKSN